MRTIPNNIDLSTLIQYINDINADVFREIEQAKSLSGEQEMFGNLNMKGHRILNLPPTPSGEYDAITKNPVENSDSGLILEHNHEAISEGGQLDHDLAMVSASLLDDDHTQYILADGTRGFSGNQSMGANRLTDVADPVTNQDAATKKYTDDQSLLWALILG